MRTVSRWASPPGSLGICMSTPCFSPPRPASLTHILGCGCFSMAPASTHLRLGRKPSKGQILLDSWFVIGFIKCHWDLPMLLESLILVDSFNIVGFYYFHWTFIMSLDLPNAVWVFLMSSDCHKSIGPYWVYGTSPRSKSMFPLSETIVFARRETQPRKCWIPNGSR